MPGMTNLRHIGTKWHTQSCSVFVRKLNTKESMAAVYSMVHVFAIPNIACPQVSHAPMDTLKTSHSYLA